MPETLPRCPWADGSALYMAYHDDEWGVPVHDDRVFFEFLVLEGAQAGLSWSTILNKRDGYREAFAGFDPAQVARFDARDVARLMTDPGIVRNRLKIESARDATPGRFSTLQREFGTFDRYVWAFVGGKPMRQPPAHARGRAGAHRGVRRAVEGSRASAASASSGRRSCTRSCRRPVWSTTTSSRARAGPPCSDA